MPASLYQRIFEYSPDALLVVDVTGRITLANHEAEVLLGYDRSELIGQSVELLVPQRVATRHASLRAHYGRNPHSRPMGAASELTALCKDGREVPVDIMLSPMIVGGEPLTLCVVRDITERKAATDKLK